MTVAGHAWKHAEKFVKTNSSDHSRSVAFSLASNGKLWMCCSQRLAVEEMCCILSSFRFSALYRSLSAKVTFALNKLLNLWSPDVDLDSVLHFCTFQSFFHSRLQCQQWTATSVRSWMFGRQNNYIMRFAFTCGGSVVFFDCSFISSPFCCLGCFCVLIVLGCLMCLMLCRTGSVCRSSCCTKVVDVVVVFRSGCQWPGKMAKDENILGGQMLFRPSFLLGMSSSVAKCDHGRRRGRGGGTHAMETGYNRGINLSWSGPFWGTFRSLSLLLLVRYS